MKSSEYLKIPFYREKYRDSLDKKEMITIDKREINKSFPGQWLTKKLKKAIDEGKTEWAATSGTTSDRLHIIRPKKWWRQEYNWLNHKLFGPNSTPKRAVLTTALCSANVCSTTQPSYRERCIDSALYLNIQQDPNCWQRQDIERMITEIQSFNPRYLLADPVYLLLFIKKMIHYKVKVSYWPFSRIIVGYELLTQFNRKIIQLFFPLQKLQQLYGSTETGFHILEAPSGALICYHHDSEIVLRKWRANIYEMIISSWKNPYMPLINYEIGDLVKTEDSTSAIIRHPDRITAFMGRKKDIFHFRNTSYTIGEIDAVVGRSDVTIAQYQIHTAKNKIKLYYTSLTDHPLSTEEKEVVQQNLEILFLQNLKVEFLHLFSISPEVSGKFSIVI